MELGTTFFIDFITSDPATGAAIDADELPTVLCFEDDVDTSFYTPSVAKRTDQTGNYRVKVEVTEDNGFEASKSYSMVALSTVSEVSGKAVIANFVLEMSNVTKIASALDIDIPAGFEPDMTDFPLPAEPLSLTDAFGLDSGYEFMDVFLAFYDQSSNSWKNNSAFTGQAPLDVQADIYDQLQAISIYTGLKATWDFNYSVQRDIQWRVYIAEQLIAAT